MMKKFLVIVSLLMCACGSPSEKEDKLLGNWYLIVNGYLVGLSFSDNFVYEADIISPLSNGIIGIEAEVGDYWVQDNQIFFTPAMASCLTHDHSSDSEIYDFPRHDNLRLVSSQGVLLFERLNPTNINTNSVGQYGCFDNNVLTPHPIERL